MTALAIDTLKPRGEARRKAILAVARDVFLAQGYAATSMSEIAARLGGSKGTLYNYFGSKQELFAAFMVETCEGPANAIFDTLPPHGADLRATLIDLGDSLLNFLFSEPTFSINRLVIAEAGRFPELGRTFYETGPKRGAERIAAYLAGALERGQLRQCDPIEAGHWFGAMIRSDLYTRRLWGVLDDIGPQEIRTHCATAVDIFLAAFGPDGGWG